MKIISLLFLALFTVGTEAVKGSNRQLQCDDKSEPHFPQEGDCEICSKCNKDRDLLSVTFKYVPEGQNSRYQNINFATCVAATYPAVTTVTAAGQSFALSAGDIFTLLPPSGKDKFDAETDFSFNNFADCFVHLSCSAPIVAGDQIGPFEIQGTEFCAGGSTDCSFPGCLVCDSDNKEFPNGQSRKPTELTFIYRASGQNSLYQPSDKASCRAGAYPSSTTLTVEGQTISVTDGQQFTVSSSDGGNFPAELDFVISGFGECFIHASCSVPIIAGDVIGPFEVVGDNLVCIPCDECIKVDKKSYNCGDPITVDFDITTETDILGQTGALNSDWIGVYSCSVPFTDQTFFYPVMNKYVCDQFIGQDSALCQTFDEVYNSGTVVLDRLPSYGAFGPFIWPVTAFIEDGQVNDQFKVVIMRNDGPSPPPFVPICESECFTIVPDQNVRECQVRQTQSELPPVQSFCFPGDATVQVQGQGPVAMKDLTLGDKVLTKENHYEPIYSFGHKNAHISHGYVKLSTALFALEVSIQHMVYVKGGAAVPAGSIKVGDELEMVNGQFSPVRAIDMVDKEGAFAPFTASGNIIVNGIKASNFIAFQESANLHIAGINTGVSFQALAHVFEFPHRMWCLHLSSCPTETYTQDGISTWVNLPNNFFKFLFSNNSVVLAVVAAVTMAVATKTRKASA